MIDYYLLSPYLNILHNTSHQKSPVHIEYIASNYLIY